MQHVDTSEMQEVTRYVDNEFSLPAGPGRDDAPCRGRDETPATAFATAPLDTHWSRILYCDLFAARGDDIAGNAPPLGD